VIGLSRQWQQDLDNLIGHSHTSIIYNPIVLKSQVIPQVKKSDEEIRFIFMGRLGSRKGVFDILEAAKRIENKFIRIYLYGDGDIEKVNRIINEEGLNQSVKVSSWISGSEKEKAFRTADVLLLPSYSEGLPMSVLEALSYGLPVISTAVGGTAEAILHQENGLLITPGDVEALTKSIDMLATSYDLRKKMGEASYRLAQTKFDLSTVMRQLTDLYSGLLPAQLENSLSH